MCYLVSPYSHHIISFKHYMKKEGDVYRINCSRKSVHVGDVYGTNYSINACCNIILKSRMGTNVCT